MVYKIYHVINVMHGKLPSKGDNGRTHNYITFNVHISIKLYPMHYNADVKIPVYLNITPQIVPLACKL